MFVWGCFCCDVFAGTCLLIQTAHALLFVSPYSCLFLHWIVFYLPLESPPSTLEFPLQPRLEAGQVEKRGEGYFLKDNPNIRVSARAHKMSKSRGNVINPDDIVWQYGADSLRLYEMFMGPLRETKVCEFFVCVLCVYILYVCDGSILV